LLVVGSNGATQH